MPNDAAALVLAEPQEPVSMELFTLLREQATTLIKTGFLPAHLKTPEQAVAVVLIGRELGVPMMQALRKIFVIQGTPALASELMLALAERTRKIEDLRIEDDGMTCTVTVKRKGRKSPVTTAFSGADAAKMGLAEKDNWKKQPAVMRRWRAIAANLRLSFPDAIGGMYSVEEVAPDLAVDATGTPAIPSPISEEAIQANLMPRKIGEPGERVAVSALDIVTPAISEAEMYEALLGIAPVEPVAPPAEREHVKVGDPRGSAGRELVEDVRQPLAGFRFVINGKEITTAGITKETLLKAFKLSAMADELEGKGRAKDLLGREFGLEHRQELTEPQVKQYVAELVKIVNRHGGKA